MNSKLRLKPTALVILLVGILSLVVIPTVLTQEATAPPEPGGIADAPYNPVVKATSKAVIDEYHREVESRSIFDFHIAYLIAADAVASGHMFSAQAVSDTLAAVPISSWEEFSAQNALFPFQILLIHESMIQAVDTE